MARGNPDKLIPQNKRTKKEQSEIARKGGIASGVARREKKRLSTIYGEMLAGKYEVTINGEKQKLDGAELVRFIMRDVLMRRDSASVSLLKEMREALEGSKVSLLGEDDGPVTFEIVEPKRKDADTPSD
jgi:hypothetical protein